MYSTAQQKHRTQFHFLDFGHLRAHLLVFVNRHSQVDVECWQIAQKPL